MNSIQKHKSKISKVYLNKEDIFENISKLSNNLLDLMSFTPLDYSIQIHLADLEDVSMEFTEILLSFIKTVNNKKIPITLIIHSKLSDLLLSLSLGNLIFSIELNEESK